MIEVAAKLKRGSVYFAAEALECLIRFSNASESGTDDGFGELETIAWASVQLHCFCTVNESRVNVISTSKKKNSQNSPSRPTSFIPHLEEQGHCVFQTPVKVLFCDLQLAPGESKSFKYHEVLQSNIPPTYRGPSCKYSYKLSIGSQRVGRSTKLLRIPFRVLIIYGLTEYLINQTMPTLTNNPFLEDPSAKVDLQEIALDVLNTMTSRRSSRNVKIANSSGVIGVFSLIKTTAKIGEDFVGVFDFTDGTVPCVQYTVCLQSEEILSEEYQRIPGQGNAVISYGKIVEFCLFTRRTHVIIPVPLHITPGFMTDLVCLKWRLHFEFTAMTSPLTGLDYDVAARQGKGDKLWQGPGNMKTDLMTWEIPVQVVPTLPAQAENPATSHTISVIKF